MLSFPVKGGWIHRVPVHRELSARREEILSDWPSRKRLQRACERMRSYLGQPITPHWLRRSFAERLVALKVEREVVGALLGHSARSITVAHYAAVTWREMVEAINRLHYSSPQLSLFGPDA